MKKKTNDATDKSVEQHHDDAQEASKGVTQPLDEQTDVKIPADKDLDLSRLGHEKENPKDGNIGKNNAGGYE